MSFSLTQIFAMGVAYLSFFFLVAYFTEQGYLPAKFVRHPAVYTLSLGVFASAWAIYGAVGYASQHGFNFLAYFLGISGAFMLAPLLLAPILRLIKNYQLGSLADLFAFRYRSPWVGTAVTVCMLISSLPLLAIQIQAVADSIHVLNQDAHPDTLAFLFCCTIILFAILFGARHITSREKHEGLVVAIAFESIFKLVAMLMIAGYILFELFGGPLGLHQWLAANPAQTERLYEPLYDGPWRTIIAAFFLAAVTAPHMFHMAFTENINPRALLTAAWGLPLYLLLFGFSIPIILWGATVLNPNVPTEYLTLGIPLALNQPWLAMLIFIAGLSAASGVIIVCTLALSAMCLNHLILPLTPVNTQNNLYSWLIWTRRALIAAIIFISFGFYYLLENRHSLSVLGFLTFVGTSQFAPGLAGVLFWPRANWRGFLAGLLAGMMIWFFGLLMPLLFNYTFTLSIPGIYEISIPTFENSHHIASFALFLNTIVFSLVSLLSRSSSAEQMAAEACNVNNLRRSYRWELSVHSAHEFIDRLAVPLGASAAHREVELALHDLAMSMEETRPYSLRRLRDQLETNLSGLLGPSMAHDMIEESLPYTMHTEGSATKDIRLVESRLEEYQHKLTGLAAELDSLRRFHRQTLQDLPVGVCSVGNDGEVLGWNHAIEQLTQIPSVTIVGSNIEQLDEPWRSLFIVFIDGEETHNYRRKIKFQGMTRWLSLHKAAIRAEQESQRQNGLVLVIEDQTEMRLLEHQLTHNERLASVGRLAAGVAHEIGNPITGIACLAQNMISETQDPDMSEMSQQILDQTRRVSRIVQSLVSFSHSGNTQVIREAVNLHLCAQGAIDLVKLSKRGRDYKIDNLIDSEHIVSGDEQRLTQVLVNLLGNSIDASEPGTLISLRSTAYSHSIALEVEDQGCGIPKDILDRIFEPFVTTKDPGKGTGLGMSLVYSIIEEHDGQIGIESPSPTTLAGTRVTITLPRYQTSVTPVTPQGTTRQE